MSPRPSPVPPRPSSARRALVAACVGNAVEWYDFAVYGALAVVVTPIFFPTEQGADVLLAAFAVYATAFLVRPIGAVVFGRWADARGRRGLLVTVLLMMSLATTAVGALPGHAAIGLLAPCALVLLRATQGLAAGGELGLAAVFIAESAPDGQRGAYSAWHTSTLALGVAAGLGVGGLVTLLPAEQVAAGWWRLAFLIALPLGLTGGYLRWYVRESPLFLGAAREGSLSFHPVRELWRDHRRGWVTGFVLVAAGSLGFNTFFVFLPNHLVATTDRTASAALLSAVVGLLCGALSALVLGGRSDTTGRRPVVLGSTLALGLGAVPVVLLAQSGSLAALLLANILAGTAVGGVLSVSTLAEMFPTRVRGTGLAMTAGLASAAVGGTAPFVNQLLFLATGLHVAPALYVTALAAAAFAILWSWPETAFSVLT